MHAKSHGDVCSFTERCVLSSVVALTKVVDTITTQKNPELE